MTFRISGRASSDLDDGWSFYDDRDEGLGEYFFTSVMADIQSLRATAGSHRKFFGFHRLLCSRFPHAVYYRVEGDIVFIWRVLDCRQDPRRIRRALPR